MIFYLAFVDMKHESVSVIDVKSVFSAIKLFCVTGSTAISEPGAQKCHKQRTNVTVNIVLPTQCYFEDLLQQTTHLV